MPTELFCSFLVHDFIVRGQRHAKSLGVGEVLQLLSQLQSCLTLCDPINGSPAGSPVPGILQARTLEWVAISFSNAGKGSRSVDSSRPHDCSLPGSSIPGILQARVLEWVAIALKVVEI